MNALADKHWLSNCCSAGVHRDTETCLKCGEHCSAMCEYCDVDEGDDCHLCYDCETELTEKQCQEWHGCCMDCSRLLS